MGGEISGNRSGDFALNICQPGLVVNFGYCALNTPTQTTLMLSDYLPKVQKPQL